jgi:hypothetical protein
MNLEYDTFTLYEARQRVKAVKEFLSNKERVSFLFSEELTHLYVPGYDPFDEYCFVSTTSISRELLVNHIRFNKDKFKGEFRNVPAFDYPKMRPQLLKVLCVFGMKFFTFNGERFTKSAVVCMGSRHHAPRVLWREESTKRVIFDKIPAYLDLF